MLEASTGAVVVVVVEEEEAGHATPAAAVEAKAATAATVAVTFILMDGFGSFWIRKLGYMRLVVLDCRRNECKWHKDRVLDLLKSDCKLEF